MNDRKNVWFEARFPDEVNAWVRQHCVPPGGVTSRPNKSPHVTLRYIRGVTGDQVDRLQQEAKGVMSFDPPKARLGYRGYFPQTQVCWVGVQSGVPLDIHSYLDRLCLDAGLPPSDYPTFTPHVSVGWNVHPHHPGLLEWLTSEPREPCPEFEFESFGLYGDGVRLAEYLLK